MLKKASDKFDKQKRALCTILIMLSLLCASILGAFFSPIIGSSEARALTQADVQNEINAAAEYGEEKEIIVDSDLVLTSPIDVGSAKKIRFVAAAEGNTLTFAGGLTIQAEAQVTFDLDVVFYNREGVEANDDVTVYGTLIINEKLYNTVNVKAANTIDDQAEIISRGVVVGGSFNNDAANGGTITIEKDATFATRASDEYTVVKDGKQETHSRRDGGTLMLKANDGDLGIVDNGGVLQNDGSIVYEAGNSAPACSGSGAVTAATFVTAAEAMDYSDNAGTYVVYSDLTLAASPSNVDYPSAEQNVMSSVTFGAAINLLSFGKVTFKLGEKGLNYTVSAQTNIGGGIDDASGKEFTQGANELIFDGGAVWEKSVSGGTSKVDYANRRYSSGTYRERSLIFYDENNEVHYYDNAGIQGADKAFFDITGGAFSVYGGTKITNYARDNNGTRQEASQGGGVCVGNGLTFGMYGGEISHNGVLGTNNGSVGAGIYSYGGIVNIYGGLVTRNAAETFSYGSSGDLSSADGPGVAVVNGGTANLYGGEISFNHGAMGGVNINADGGGLMLDNSSANVYGGKISNNYTGGSGGGICAWKSALNMTGGEISHNRAAFGGGIGTTANDVNARYSTVDLSGGEITGNEAVQNYSAQRASGDRAWGGYGGGVCLGSAMNIYGQYSYMTVSGEDTLISGNKAYYGGGLAVYCQSGNNSNQLTMSGGLISGNVAYELPTVNAQTYYDTYDKPVTENGGGVYVESHTVGTTTTITRAMLLLSGSASIDSSNAVSFNADTATIPKDAGSDVAPIEITGDLTGNGLGALVYLARTDICPEITSNRVTIPQGKWYQKTLIHVNKDKVPASATAETYLNKFVLDTSATTTYDTYKYSLSASGYNISTTNTQTADASTAVAQIGSGSAVKYFASLEDAVSAAVEQGGDVTIELLNSATVGGQMNIPGGSSITIKPAQKSDADPTLRDITLVISANANFSDGGALFNVAAGGALTLDGGDGGLTFDGNGKGRYNENANVAAISLVDVRGTFEQKSNVVLRNSIAGQNALGSAVSVWGSGRFTMYGGAIEDNTSLNALGSAVYLRDSAVFDWRGGAIADNVTEGSAVGYGVYISSTTAKLNINTTDGNEKLSLTNNVIYVGATQIDVTDMTYCDGNVGLVFPDVSTLDTDTKVVSMGTNNYFDKFYIAQAQDGLELGAITENGTNYIRILRFVTYIFDMRYDVNNGTATDPVIEKSSDGITIATPLAIVDGEGNVTGGLISTIAGTSGGITVKTRKGGYVIAVTMRSDRQLSPEVVAAISDAYTRVGMYTNGFVDDTNEHKQFSFDSAQSYVKSDVPITLSAVWSNNVYDIAYNHNLPEGVLGNNVVSPGFTSFNYGDLSDDGKNVIDNGNMKVVGYAFSGWRNAAAGGDELFGSYTYGVRQSVQINGDLDKFTASTTYRGRYTLTAYASWTPVFGGGAGTEISPFVITDAEHIARLNDTLDGKAVKLTADGKITYPETDINGYRGYYFSLETDIEMDAVSVDYALAVNPFKGYFDGNLNKVKLNGKALFGALESANVHDIALYGSVAGDTGYIGALAQTSAGGSTVARIAFSKIGSVTAEVTATGSAVAGGIVGKMTGGTIADSFNYGDITSATVAGGIVGEMEGGTVNSVYNTGKVVGATAGGLIGKVSNVTMQYSFNGGVIEAADGASTDKIGAIAGDYATNVVLSNIYYNSDKMSLAHPGARGLTSSKMYVSADGVAPEMMTLVGDWTFELCTIASDGTQYYYYPQLRTFHDNAATLELSRESVKIMKTETDPVTPETEFVYNYYTDPDEYDKADKTAYASGVFTLDRNRLPSPTDPTRTGYTFSGWCTDTACTVQFDFAGGVPASDISLYAKWDLVEYEIRYTLNDQTNTAYMQGEYNKTVTVLNNSAESSVLLANDGNVVFAGYRFKNWMFNSRAVTSVAIVGENFVFFDGQTELSEKLPLSRGVVELYASWEAVPYHITYSSRGLGSGTRFTHHNVEQYVITDTFALTPATATGYEFLYWSTSATSDADEFKIDLIRGMHADITLYAVFQANTYKIYFNPGEGKTTVTEADNITLDTKNGLYYADVTFDRAPSVFAGVVAERDGYDFDGWFMTTAGTNEFDFAAPYNTADNLTLYAKYTPKLYSLTVDAGDGAFAALPVSLPDGMQVDWVEGQENKQYIISNIPHGENVYEYLVSPAQVGSTFSGWDNIGAAVRVTVDATVTAKYNSNATVIFSYNGKTEPVTVNADNKVTPPTDTDRIGYTFDGWFSDAALTNRVDLTTATFTSSAVLFAKYSPKVVDIRFYVNDPCSSDGDVAPTFNQDGLSFNYDTVFGNHPASYIGYTFAGWYYLKDGVKVYAAGLRMSELDLTENGDIYTLDLTAEWTEETYDIFYNYDGGEALTEDGPYPAEYKYADTFGGGIYVGGAKRTGYQFDGWELNGVALDDGTVSGQTVYRIPAGRAEDITLRARWTVLSFAVTFNAGEGVFNGAGPNYSQNNKIYTVSVNYGTAAPRPIDPTLEGHSFMGWPNLPSVITQAITVTAQYSAQNYTAFFDGNGGTVNKPTIQIAYRYNIMQALADNGIAPVLEGHRVLRYDYITKAGTLVDTDTMPANNITLKVIWEKLSYVVTVDCEDETAADSIIAKITDKYAAPTKTAVEGSGRFTVTFGVPYESILVELNGIKNSSNQTLTFKNGEAAYDFGAVKRDTNLTAGWVQSVVTVTLNNFDGEHSQDLMFTPGSGNKTLPAPTRDGYTFGGWFDNEELTGTAIRSVNIAESDITLFANWTATEYIIEYFLNGGNNDPTNPATYTIVDGLAVSDVKPAARDGYTFVKWCTNAALTIPFVGITPHSSPAPGNIMLFAQWEANTYTLVVKDHIADDGAKSDKTITVNYGDNAVLLDEITKRLYHNVALYDATGKQFTVSGATVPALETLYKFEENTTYTFELTVTYSPVNYSIHFYGESDGMTYNYTDNGVRKTIEKTAEPTENGKIFSGWSVSATDPSRLVTYFVFEPTATSGNVTFHNSDNVVVAQFDYADNITLYAVFADKRYTVSFQTGTTQVLTALNLAYGQYDAIPAIDKSLKPGYTFAGWAQSDSETAEVIYPDQSAIMLNGDNTTVTLYAKWNIDVYRITYILDGGVNNANNPGDYSISDADLPLEDPTRTGYTFDGWFVTDNGTEKEITAVAAGTTGDLIVTAKWTINKYTVTIDCADNTAAQLIRDQYIDNGATIKEDEDGRYNVAFTVEHGTVLYLLGNIELGGNRLIYDPASITSSPVTSDISNIRAEWTSSVVTVTLNRFYGNTDGVAQAQVLTYAANSGGKTLPTPTLTGYTFGGWFDNAECSGEAVTSVNIVNAAHTLYAKWEINEYSIEYVLGDGSVNHAANPAVYNVETPKIVLQAPTRTGYTFGGWFTDAAYTESRRVTEIAQGSTGNITLFAKWNINTYTVTFDPNGGSVTVAEIEYTVVNNGQTFEIPTRTGYKFDGWYTEAENGEKVENLSGSTGSFTLYAHWSLDKFTIAYELNGGALAGGVTNITEYDVTTPDITFNDPTRTGYMFGGWFDNADLSGERYTGIAQGSTGDKTFYADWIANEYVFTVTVDGSVQKTVTVNYGDAKSVFYDEIERNHYTVALTLGGVNFEITGETIPALETISEYAALFTHAEGTNVYSATLVAKYAAIEYYIYFAGVNVADGTRLSYKFDSDPIEIVVAYKPADGYRFLGWSVSNDGSGIVNKLVIDKDNDKVLLISVKDDGETEVARRDIGADITLIAIRELIQYTVKFDTGISQSIADMVLTYGQVQFLPNLTAERTGYTFGGWSNTQNGATVDYRAGATIILQDEIFERTLYAVWTPVTYTVTYDLDGGTMSGNNPGTFTVEKHITTLPTPSKNGYEFKGWYIGDAEVESTDGHTESFTVTAKWEKETYTITYVLNGGNFIGGVNNPDSYTVESDTVTLAIPTREYYDFAGWFEKADFSDTAVTEISSGSTGDKTLYAKWTPTVYTITYVLNGGTNHADNPTQFTISYDADNNVEKITLKAPTRTGYTFGGWYDNGNFTGSAITEISTDCAKSLTLYAEFTLDTVSVKITCPDEIAANLIKTEYGGTVSGNVIEFTVDYGTTLAGLNGINNGANRLVYKFGEQAYSFAPVTEKLELTAEWTSTVVTVTLENIYGAGTSQAITYAPNSGNQTLPAPSRTGYTFGGWIKDGAEVTEVTIENSDITVTAVWTKITYNITYELYGGTNGNNPSTYDVETATVTLVDPSRAGYRFDGWYNTSSFTQRVQEIANGSIGDRTLFAKWTANSFRITYELNGGTNDPSNPGTYTIEDAVALAEPTRNNYTFGGWFESEDLTGSAVTVIPQGSTDDKTLYAKWTATEYTITYVLDGGTMSGNNPDTFTVEKHITTLPTPSKIGHIFSGWYIGDARVDSTSGHTESFTVTAVWTANVYEFTVNGYVSNDGSTLDMPVSVRFGDPVGALDGITKRAYHNVTLTLGSVEFVITGDTVPALETMSQYAASFMHAEGTNVYSATLDVSYEAIVYTVGYSDGGSVKYSFTDKTPDIVKDYAGTPAEGRVFASWGARNSDLDLEAVTSFEFDAENGMVLLKNENGVVREFAAGDPITLTAMFVAKMYTVSFVTGVDGMSIENMTLTYNVLDILPAIGSRTGYTFNGWATSAGGTVEYANQAPITLTQDEDALTLYAVWEANTYSISYNLNDGTVSGNPDTYTIETETFTLNKPTRKGYIFAGWTGTGLTGATETVTITKGSTSGNKAFTAMWTAKTCTLTFENLFGVSYGNITLTFDVERQLAAIPDGARTGYTFDGWATSNGGNVAYADGGTITLTEEVDTMTLYAVWTATPYSVTYDLGGGENASGNPDSYTIESEDITLADPTRTGYTFGGWYTEAGFVNKVDKIAQGSTGNKTFYAKWTPTAYNYTYKYNDGNTADKEVGYTVVSDDITLEVPTRNGYTFDGWFESEDLTGSAVTVILQGSTGDKTLYAKWTAIPYTVTYNYNYDSIVRTGSFTAAVEVLLVKPERTGYNFEGWFDNEALTGNAVESIPQGSTGDKIYYAKWTINRYDVAIDCADELAADRIIGIYADAVKTVGTDGRFTVTFEVDHGTTLAGLNGIVNGSNRLIFTVGGLSYAFAPVTGDVSLTAEWTSTVVTVTLVNFYGTSDMVMSFTPNTGKQPLPMPTRNHYTFGGWFTDGACTAGNEAVEVDTDTVTAARYYAKWTPNPFAITYNYNYGNTVDTDSYTVESEDITLPTPTRAGYAFDGWFESADFSGSKIESIPHGSTGNKTFYAKWTADKYTVTFVSDGGSAVGPLEYTIESNDITLPISILTGYTFGGWFENEELTGAAVAGIPQGSTGNKTLYAKWTPTDYTITYELGGGENTSGNPASYTIKSEDITLTDPTRTGYTFAGWLGGDGNAVTGVAIAHGSVGDRTFTAQWTAIEYVITYNLGGGTNNPANPASYTVVSDDITLAGPTRLGYTFTGWLGGDGNAVTGVAIAHGSVGDRTFTAQWKIIDYTVTFISNGGSAVASVTYDVTRGVNEFDKPTRTGYTFLGWFENNEEVQKIETGETGNRTLVADWKTIEYTVTYILGGGENASANPDKYTIETRTIVLADATRTGYTFGGWFGDDEFGERVTIIDIGSYGDIRLYAKWDIIDYGISYNLGGGTNNASNPAVYNIESGDITLADPTRLGYRFTGWTGGDGNVVMGVAIAHGSVGDRSFTAQWEVIAFTLTFNSNGGSAIADITVRITDNTVELPTPVKTGIDFRCWVIGENGTAQYNGVTSVASVIAAANSTTVNFVAVWANETFFVTFDFDGGEATGEYVTRHVKGAAISLPAVEKNNYVLDGWEITGGATPVILSADATDTGNDVDYDSIIKAIWKPIKVETIENTATTATVRVDDSTYDFAVVGGTYDGTEKIAFTGTEGYGGKFAVWYGLAKNGTYSIGARSFDFDAYDWSKDIPVDAGDYKILIAFMHDGDEADISPEQKGYTVDKGYIVLDATIAQAENAITVLDDNGDPIADSASFVYGSAYGFTVRAVVNAENAALAYAQRSRSIDKPVNVGKYSVTVTVPATRNYKQAEKTVEFDITKKQISVTVRASGVYGDDVDLSGATIEPDGLIDGDSLSVGFDYGAPDGVDVGTHGFAVTPRGTEANYDITETHGYYTVTKRSVTVTIGNIQSYYGKEISLDDVVCTATNLASGDTLADLGLCDFVTTATAFAAAGGIYTIGCDYTSDNYDVTIENGFYRIAPLEVEIEIAMDGGAFNTALAPATIDAVKCDIDGVDLDTVCEQLKDLLAEFVYTGTTAGGAPYTSIEVPTEAGSYFVMAVFGRNDNYRISNSVKSFDITKSQNRLVSGGVVIEGWTYGKYDAAVNAPSSSAALEGVVYFTYSDSVNGTFTRTVPASGNAGVYYVRAEVDETANYRPFASEPVEFRISPVKIAVPSLGIVEDGENRNTVYTGADLLALIGGYDKTIMSITYDGTAIPQDGNVTVVAHNAGTYTVKFMLTDVTNYEWEDGANIVDGYAVREWVVKPIVVELPKQAENDFPLSGLYITFIPDGFDASIMDIVDNVGVFAGEYTAYITLKDPVNYVWATGGADRTAYVWRVVGVNKVFVAIVVTASVLICAAGAVTVVLLVRNRKTQKFAFDPDLDGGITNADAPAQSSDGARQDASADNAGSSDDGNKGEK